MDIKFIIVVFSFTLLIILIRSFYEVNTIKTTKYNICLPELDKKQNIVFFSDFHSIKKEKYIEKIIRKIDEINPVYILICGDMLIGKKNACNESAVYFLEKLSTKYEIYYTFGNHESRMIENSIADNCDYFYRIKALSNVKILNNKQSTIFIGNQAIDICGLTFSEKYYKKLNSSRPKIQEISKIFQRNNGFSIVLCHKPDFFKEISCLAPDIVLSGHNHGGIVRLPFLGGVISTSYRLFPKYSYGLYKLQNSIMILTSGIGTHTVHFRLFNKPEIVNIEFDDNK